MGLYELPCPQGRTQITLPVFFVSMAESVEVRDTEDKGMGTEGKATKRGIDLPKKIRFPVDRSWWAWARAQDRIREIGAYNPTHNDKSNAIETANRR